MFQHNSYTGKNRVPEIFAKMLSANQIAGYLNQLFLQNKSVKQPHFLHVYTNSQKFKVEGNIFGWALSKMDVANLVSGL